MIKKSDEILIVTTPDLPSVTDALKTVKLAEEHDATVIGVVLNRYSGKEVDMTAENIEKMLGRQILAIVPEDKNVKKSIKLKHPVTYAYPMSPSSLSFKKAAAKLIGEKYEVELDKREKSSKFHHVLKKLGLG
jgi:septum site-determining protein MinD